MKIRKLLAGLALIGLTATSVMAAAGPAQARGWMGRTGYAYDGHTLGTLRPTGYDEQAVCIDSLSDLPSKRTSPSKKNKPLVNYLMQKYGQTESNTTAAALGYIVKREMADPDFAMAKTILASLDSSTEAAVRSKIDSLWAEAQQFAGPYTMMQPRVEITDPTVSATDGTVSNLAIRAASGAYISGVRITLVLSGPAVFDSTGTSTRTITSSAALQSVAFHATDTGSIDVSAASDKTLAGNDVYVHPSPSGTNDQRMVTAGPLVAVSAVDPTGGIEIVPVTVDSSVAKPVIGTEQYARDTVFVGGGPAGATVTVTTTLYGPLAAKPSPAAEVPDGLDEVMTLTDQVQLDGSGAGRTTLETDTPLAAPGWYVFVEAVKDDPNLGITGATGTWARPSEMFYVYQPPAVATQTSAQVAAPGTTISDTATVTGIEPGLSGVEVTMDAELRGPIDPVKGKCTGLDWADAPLVELGDDQHYTVTADGDISGIGKYEVKKAGCYSYGETLQAVLDGWEIPIWVTQHAVGQAAQTTLVYAPADVATKASAQLALAGATLSDTATVTGIIKGAADTTVTLSGELRGPAAPVNNSCAGVDWSAAPVARVIEPQEVTEDGEIAGLGEYTVKDVGCYSWGEKLTATAAGEPLWQTDHAPGKVTQTALTIAPVITTQIASTKTVPGAVLSDTISLAGTSGTPGVIGGQLLGPMPPVGGKCAAVDWSKAPVAQELAKITTSGDGIFTSGKYEVKKVGCYTYWETWTSTTPDQAIAVSTKPGEVTETALIRSGNDRDGGLDIGSGFGLTGVSNGPLGLAGVAVVAGLALAGWLLLRKRSTEQ